MILKVFVPGVQKKLIQHFHLHGQSFFEWSVWHFIPWMYNYENEIWMSRDPLDVSSLSRDQIPQGVYHEQVNHFPLRTITFGWHRYMFYSPNRLRYIYIRSRYQSMTLLSHYVLEKDQRGLMIRFQGTREYHE